MKLATRTFEILLLLLISVTLQFQCVLSKPASSSPAVGQWFLNLNVSSTNIYATLSILEVGNGSLAAYFSENRQRYNTSNITYNSDSSSLSFFVNQGEKQQQWFLGTIVLGVIKGRFSISSNSSKPESFSPYIYHFTGWNAEEFPLAPPVAYDIILNGNCSAKLRIDLDPISNSLIGRFKVYFCFSGEELEYDISVDVWDGMTVVFTRTDVVGGWTQYFKGETYANVISGLYFDSRTNETYPFNGTRANILAYGLVAKNETAREAWQIQTRLRVEHLLMAGNPPAIGKPVVVSSRVVLNESYSEGASRDDNPEKWPQNFTVTEYHFQYSIQDPYSNNVITRDSHAYLALPNDLAEGEQVPAILAVNGHRGSGWQQLFTNSSDIYWYGNGYARRKYIVLSLDISHRNDSPLYSNYNLGDDPNHGNGPHPAIISSVFQTTDWEEDGERTWDARRALDFLLEQPQVDPARVIVGGLSMGGGITTYVAALDLRIQAAAAAGWSPDLDVIVHHGNHPCFEWVYANIREYIDSSDLIALIAPRPFVVETGKQDFTFSNHIPPFSGDKQVARRSRAAYGDDVTNFVHYLHYDVHRYHVGDVNPLNSSAEMWVQVPIEISPQNTGDLTWQSDPSTVPVSFDGNSPYTLFDLLDLFFQS